ncbi:uncharacterized protein LOC113327997 isoform X1 [Papaver somniferum]|uniref:uncharacterized protein LOC113327997 isoform X1 n=1 Tax=Papaver somniferum TaxID=3469 RepID=UPI000E7017BE|nr:uncharacterized protein LOC113327997 isoform X1 [Papaver somniferum]
MDKFKVICIAWNYIEIQNTHVYTTQYFFKIVTLGTGIGSDSWRDIDIPKMDFYLGGDGYKPVSVDGSLNLLCLDDKKVLYVDVSRESSYTVEYPEGASNTSQLLEIGGSLCILDYTEESHNDIESDGKLTREYEDDV